MTTPPVRGRATRWGPSPRAVRQRYVKERQRTAFGIALTLLILVGLFSGLAFAGVIGSDVDPTAARPASDSEKVPCLDDGTLPVTAKDIHVRVLNATGRPMLANAVNAALVQRGFTSDGIATDSQKLTETRIVFGKNAIAAAYTVAAHFPGPELVMDDRADGLIDVYVGTTFDDLVPIDQVKTDPKTPLANPVGCVSLDEIHPPRAPEHSAAPVPSAAS